LQTGYLKVDIFENEHLGETTIFTEDEKKFIKIFTDCFKPKKELQKHDLTEIS